MRSKSDRTVILEFLTKCIETAAGNAAKFGRLRRIMADKTIDGSFNYWSTVLKGYKYQWFLAGGDNAGCQAIIERIERAENEQPTSV